MGLDRVTIPDNVLDRLDELERRLGDIIENCVTPQSAPNASDDAASVLSGWVITGGVLRDAGSLIVLDPSIPGIQIAAGGRIFSSDFVAGVSGFNINGGTAEFNDVVIRGTIYASVGAIGGWTIGATTISSTNITLTSGLANVASIMVGAGANAGGLNSANAAGDIIFWGGSTFANRASAPFFVTAAGALTATGATIQSAGSGARTVLDSTGIKGYDAGPVQRYQLLNDGSGWLGDSSIFAWTTAGVVSLNGSAVMANTIVGGKTNWFNVPIIDGLVITNNSPLAGYVAWNSFTLTYQGTSYTIAAGNTGSIFIWWNKASSTTVLQSGAAPAQAVNQFIVIYNSGGTSVPSLFSNIVYAHYISVVNLAAIQANIGACHIDGVLDIGASGGIYQGTGTFAAPTTGLKMWNDGGVGRIAGYNAGVLQTYFGTDGRLYAGAGDSVLDGSGMWLKSYAAYGAGGSLKFASTNLAITYAKEWSYYNASFCYLMLEALNADNALVNQVRLGASNVSVYNSFSVDSATNSGIFSNDARVGGGLYVGDTLFDPAQGDVVATADGRFGGGLYVGAVNVDPAAGTLIVTGMVGIGTDAPGVQTYAGFTNLTISGSTKAGIVELITQTADADAANVGSYRWTDKNSTAADKAVGTIQVNLSGATANNRGSRMAFYTKSDNAASQAERMRIDNVGYVGIGCTPAATFDVLGNLALRAVSPAQITGNTNDWNPGVGSFVRMTSDATYNLTGILAGVDGQIKTIVNVGGFAMTFISGSGSSAAANRMELGGSRTVNQSITLQYDATSSRWRLVSFT